MKEKWKKGWKVITKEERMSCIAGSCNCANRVYYPIDGIAEPAPGNGPLAIFKTRGSARDFLTMFLLRPYCKIVECEYIEHTGEKVLWKLEITGVKDIKDGDFPPGTAFASKVKCLE